MFERNLRDELLHDPVRFLPAGPSYKVWFASWSTAQPVAYWSDTPPNINPDGLSTWVVGVTKDDARPQDASVLGTGGKDLPPPPLELSPGDVGLSGFQDAFAKWLERRDL